MRSGARLRAMRFEWRHLVTPLTPKATVAEWSRREGEINQMVQASRSVPNTVEPIDWAYWEKEISSPGLVAEMKKEYESLSFPDIAADLTSLPAVKAEHAEAVAQAKLGEDELKETDKVIKQVAKVKAEGLNWTMEQWYDALPGLEDQHKAEYENEEYLVSDAHLKLDAVDWAAASKEIAEGGEPDVGPADAYVGDMSTAEEVELVNQGKWSVGRLFAGKDERARIQERIEKALA